MYYFCVDPHSGFTTLASLFEKLESCKLILTNLVIPNGKFGLGVVFTDFVCKVNGRDLPGFSKSFPHI